jgi:hypothetical protein
LPIAVRAKEPASLSAEDALTVALAFAPIPVQWSTFSSADATVPGGMGMEWVGMFMSNQWVMNAATPSDDRNLVLVPLWLELLKAPEKLPDFALCGVLYSLMGGIMARPAVVAKLLEHDPVAALMDTLRQVSPTELVATAGHSRRPHGLALDVMKELVDVAQAGGTDLTPQLLTSGFIDTLISALSAVEEVGAEHVHGFIVIWGAVSMPTILDGEALPQIEDKLRTIPSALRYLKDSKIVHGVAFGLTAAMHATTVAGALCALFFLAV